MTIMVDDAYIPAKVGRHQARWCHLMSDTSREELHEFAEKIGLKRSWFQDHPRLYHYDVTEGMRRKAVAAGAEEVSQKELSRRMIRARMDRIRDEQR